MSNYKNLGIGLITHSKSKYLDTDGEHEIFNNLYSSRGLDSENVKFIKLDKYNIDSVDLGLSNFFSGIIIFIKSIFKIQFNLIKKSNGFKFNKKIKNLSSDLYSILKILIMYLLFKITKKKYKKYYAYTKRQAEISDSHLELLTMLNQSHLEWILVLEDDIKLNSNVNINISLNKLLFKIKNISKVKVINLSESFSDLDLGLNGLVNEKVVVNHDKLLTIKMYDYPVTNTVCATAYRVSALNQIIQELKKLQDNLFIPIDHKLNIVFQALLQMGTISSAVYASAEPSFFIQRSLHE